MVTVCQCNIHDSGRWTERNYGAITYDTAGRFARFVASVNPSGSPYPPISVIGMQELLTEDERVTINAYLEEATHTTWMSVWFPQGVRNRSGIGVFWRPDIVETLGEWDMGETIVDKIDNGYIIKFVGRMFSVIETGEAFRFVTGKLVWSSGVLNGHRATESDRLEEALRLKAWISSIKSDAPTIITTDMNTYIGSRTWREMDADYTDPSRQHTFTSYLGSMLLDRVGRKLDYIWLSRDPSGERGWVFLDGPRRSPHFGSDHRAVYATIALSPE